MGKQGWIVNCMHNTQEKVEAMCQPISIKGMIEMVVQAVKGKT